MLLQVLFFLEIDTFIISRLMETHLLHLVLNKPRPQIQAALSIASVPDPSYFSCWARKLLFTQLLQFSQIYSSHLKLFWTCMQSGFSAASELIRSILKSSYSASAAGGSTSTWSQNLVSHLKSLESQSVSPTSGQRRHIFHTARALLAPPSRVLVILIRTESFKSSMKRAWRPGYF